jgi:predicted N-acetyltransferase YhbS
MSLQPLTIGHNDYEWHEAFIRFVPRVFPSVSFRRWYDLGGWSQDYVSYALADGGEIVANASLHRMTMIVQGRELTGWQMGAVGVLPEWRTRGLQREIMSRVLAVAAAQDVVLLFANDDVLGFYPRFGFKRISESVFGAEVDVQPAPERLQRLSIDKPDDLAAVSRIAAAAVPVTQLFGAREYGDVLLWYWTNFYPSSFYFWEEQDAIVVAGQSGDTLKIYDVQAPARIDLAACLPRIAAAPVRRLEFGFTPELLWPRARPLYQYAESPLFVQENFPLGDQPFKFPMLAQT